MFATVSPGPGKPTADLDLPVPPAYVDDAAEREERRTAATAHAMGAVTPVVQLISQGSVTVVFFMVPIIIWVANRKRSPFLDDHGREATNFQITLLIYMFVAGLLSFTFLEEIPGTVLALFAVIGAVRASSAAIRGEFFRYPACFRPVKACSPKARRAGNAA